MIGRRVSSKLPELVQLVMARPLVSAAMVAGALGVTPRAALRIVHELGLCEMTGGGSFAREACFNLYQIDAKLWQRRCDVTIT
jgi:hypothetical protein